MAVSVSDQLGGSQYVLQFVSKVLTAQPDKPPQFFLNVSPETFEKVKATVLSQAKGAKQKALWSGALSRVEGKTHNYQQDFYQSYVDSQSGRPVVREVDSYKHHPAARGQSLYKELGRTMDQICGIKTGDKLPDLGQNDGLMGGNIEGGPGGTCVLGDKLGAQHADYAKEACGGGQVLKPPTNFLAVGHSDELTMTVRTGPDDCDVAMLVASPKAALDVMRENPEEASFTDGEKSIMPYELCKEYFKQIDCPEKKTEGSGGTTTTWIRQLFAIKQAHAKSDCSLYRLGKTHNEMQKRMAECGKLPNREFLRLFEKDQDLPKVNDWIDRKMRTFQSEAEAVWKQQLPKCKPKILEVPSLFAGKYYKTDDEVGYGGEYFQIQQMLSNSVKPSSCPTRGVQRCEGH